MANHQDYTRFRQGKDHWNKWATSDDADLVDFSGQEFRDFPNFDGFLFPKGLNFSNAHIHQAATFKGCKFGGPVNFSKSNVPAIDFSGSYFSSAADFTNLRSNGVMNLTNVTFEDEVSFHNVEVNKAIFDESEFNSSAQLDGFKAGDGFSFRNAQFDRHANFSNFRFNIGSTFEGVHFQDGANFTKAGFQVFNFDGAVFSGEISFNGLKNLPKLSLQKITLKRDGVLNLSNQNFSGEIDISGSKIYGDFGFANGTITGKCSFRDCTFSGQADFHNRTFKSGTSFSKCKFRSTCKPNFNDVTFENTTSFKGAKFNTSVSFRNGSIHKGLLDFELVEFKKPVDFQFFEFHTPALFVDATFDKNADFRSIESKYEFDLSGSRFGAVPNFLFARFTEPPSFESVKVVGPLRKTHSFGDKEPRKGIQKKFAISSGPDVSHKFRKLKSLAIAGHDHRLEMDFFAGEIQAKRFWHDKPLSGTFIAGFLYQWTSDFGRSLMKPFLLG